MIIDWVELAGWLAVGLNVWGNLKLAKKSKAGWLIRLTCNAAWVVYSTYTGAWPLLVNHVLFAGINIYGWREWSKGPKDLYRCSCGRDWKTEIFQTRCVCEAVIPARGSTSER